MTQVEIIKTKLTNALPALKKAYPISGIALFGSIIRGDFNPAESDVDIMVELSGDVGYEFIELAEELETLLQIKVDLVSRNAFKPHQWNYIKSQLLYV